MRRKTKQKRSLPLSLDFVTTLTPNECRGMLYLETEQYTGDETQTARGDEDTRFWVERMGAYGPFNPSPVCFEGRFEPVAAGTHVTGQITGDTLARIRRTRRWRIATWLVVLPLALVLVVLALRATNDYDHILAVFRSFFCALFGYGVGWTLRSLGFTTENLDQLSVSLVDWLHDCLYEPSTFDLTDYETEDEEKTRPAAESRLRDHAHGG